MEKFLSGMTNKNVQTKVECKICHKSGHSEDKCFKQKTCFKCRQKGHIARYCRNETQNREHTSAFKCDKGDSDVFEPAQRTVISVNIGEQTVDFLYDTGSQFSILKRSAYDNLVHRPPLNDIRKSGIGIDGHRFDIDGVAYLNLNFLTENNSRYMLEYEPVLISKCVTSNIFGAKTENRFKSCFRDLQDSSLIYTTKENSEKVKIPCYKEKINSNHVLTQHL